jgi:hypothetical protein
VRHADGISVVLQANTGASTAADGLGALEATLHDLAVAAS